MPGGLQKNVLKILSRQIHGYRIANAFLSLIKEKALEISIEN
jgi:hypothetical protein